MRRSTVGPVPSALWTSAATWSEAAVVLRRTEQNDQRHVRGIGSGENRVHQGAPDAGALMIRKDSNRPCGNNWIGGDGRAAHRRSPLGQPLTPGSRLTRQ